MKRKRKDRNKKKENPSKPAAKRRKESRKKAGGKLTKFKESIFQLICETSSNLPSDVRRALKWAIDREDPNNQSALALRIIAKNIDIASDTKKPICQDTGMLTFEIKLPIGLNQITLRKEIENAIKEATRIGILRPNSVDSLSGKNNEDNLGVGLPLIYFEQWDKDEIDVRLILKGGGCENKSIQYSLPCELEHLGRADRTIDGIRKCLLHAVWQAQGQGCSVGIIGAAIGGDRASGYHFAKQQLFRVIDDINPNPELAKLEEYILQNANELNIGTMGFGGRSTLLGCKIGAYHRLPASFFVTVAYECWAFRRLGVILDAKTGSIKRWLYKDDSAFKSMTKEEKNILSGREISLNLPLSEEQVRLLKVGDLLLLNGMLHLGRDALHHYLSNNNSPVNLEGGAIYHCGPVALKNENVWVITAAGPTTSIREELYQSDIIRKFRVRVIIGKGGMGEKTLSALKDVGAVYASAIGGAAQYYAKCIEKVEGVDFLEFGIPEAMWHVQVKNFPVIVTMDANGNSLHKDIEESSSVQLSKLIKFKSI